MLYYDLRWYGDDFILYHNETPLIIANLALKGKVYNTYRLTVVHTVNSSSLYLITSFLKEFFSPRVLTEYLTHHFKECEDCELLAELTNPFWELVFCTAVNDMLPIIDDALTHGFEFKVENGQLWTRDIMNKM